MLVVADQIKIQFVIQRKIDQKEFGRFFMKCFLVEQSMMNMMVQHQKE
jgi:hypothetical protein